jgi:peptidoglycan/LPS O-acetylase OafA/YrhL
VNSTAPRRPPPAENNFDLIRLVAALQVAIKHAGVHLGVGGAALDVMGIFPGVPVFFLISGFLIFPSFANSQGVRHFAFNRFLRLFPALWTCLALSVASAVLVGYLAPEILATAEFWIWIAAQSTFLQFYNPEFLRGYGSGVLNGSLWTISVELQFYVLTPFLYWLLRDRTPRFLALIAAFLVPNLVMSLYPSDTVRYKLLYASFLPWLYMFLLGAWLSTRNDVVARVLRVPLWILLLAHAVALALCAVLGLRWLGNETAPLAYLSLAAIVIKLAYTMPELSSRLLRRWDISYGVYIYHMPVINLMMWYGLVGTVPSVLLATALTVAFALASWVLVERPALALKRRALRRY